MRQRRRLITAVSLVAALGLVAAACGDDDDDSSSGATTTAASGATTTAAAATTAGGATTTAGGATTTAAEEGACKPGEVVVDPIPRPRSRRRRQDRRPALRRDRSRRQVVQRRAPPPASTRPRPTSASRARSPRRPPTDGSDRPERIKSFVGSQDLIVAIGFLWGDATTASAAENPDQPYAIIDSVVNVPDCRSDHAGAERALDGVRREPGLGPGRCGGRLRLEDRQDRLHRRRRERPHQEVRGRLRQPAPRP